jgi:hypothetical protein
MRICDLRRPASSRTVWVAGKRYQAPSQLFLEKARTGIRSVQWVVNPTADIHPPYYSNMLYQPRSEKAYLEAVKKSSVILSEAKNLLSSS